MMKKSVMAAFGGIAFLAGMIAPAASKAQDQTKEELKLRLPKPMFIGTPRNIKSSNLEAITGKPRGPFFVPKGTALLALASSSIAGLKSSPVTW